MLEKLLHWKYDMKGDQQSFPFSCATNNNNKIRKSIHPDVEKY